MEWGLCPRFRAIGELHRRVKRRRKAIAFSFSRHLKLRRLSSKFEVIIRILAAQDVPRNPNVLIGSFLPNRSSEGFISFLGLCVSSQQ